MGKLSQPKTTAETRSERNLKAASPLLCFLLAGCASSWGNSAPSANAPPSYAPAVSQTAVPSPPPTALAAEEAPSDGVHPNQTITNWFRTSSSPGAAPGTAQASTNPNVPHPPSSYTPAGQPYAPPGQPAYNAPQNSGDVSAASETESDGVHPSQSITDLIRQ
jgi:hypothetical protein